LNDADGAAVERVGNVLNDKWKLERLLGVGGTAAVYAGLHRNGARAAVKVLHPELSRNKEIRERFQREGYAANKVEHPGVVKVLDDDVISDGPDKGTAYLVMELLQGESLQDRLERGPPISEGEFLQVANDVLAVLQAAHERGVVHRDLKPENLFFARDGASGAVRIKVLDFGLARLLSGQSLTMTGLALGTPSFMSPEQAAGRISEIDGRTDLFALAATGFRLRTGRRIHEAEDPVELVIKMAQLPAPRIRSVAPDVSAAYARVIDRALEFKREDRYESAAAMRADVERAIEELVGGVRESPPPPRKPAKPTLPPPRRPVATQPRAERAERTQEPTKRDVEPNTFSATGESIRIPKTGSFRRWVALLIIGGAGVALWQDDVHRTALWSSVRTWSGSLLSRVHSSAASAASAPEPPPTLPARAIADGGVPTDAGASRTVSTGIARPSTVSSGTAPSGSTSVKIRPGVRHPPRSH
jgi:serine/threonine-protein kinase